MKLICAITSLLILSSLNMNSQVQKYTIDSILQSVKYFRGEEKLNKLNDIVVKNSCLSSTGWAAAIALEQESHDQNSLEYIAKASYYKLLHFSLSQNKLSHDTLSHCAEVAIEAYAKAKLDYGRSSIEKIMFSYYMVNGYNELALYRAESFLHDVRNDMEESTAYCFLGCIYASMNQDEEAIDMLQKSINICERKTNDDHRFLNTKHTGF